MNKKSKVEGDSKIMSCGHPVQLDALDPLGNCPYCPTLCRYCKKPVPKESRVITSSYWSQVRFYCHKECKKMGEAQEAWLCQDIDASCNTCKHLKRTSTTSGVCDRFFSEHFQSKVRFHPQDYQGRSCFVPRKKFPQHPIKSKIKWELSIRHLWIGLYWETWEWPWRRDLWISIPLISLHLEQERKG